MSTPCAYKRRFFGGALLQCVDLVAKLNNTEALDSPKLLRMRVNLLLLSVLFVFASSQSLFSRETLPIQLLQISPLDSNFAFKETRFFWISSQEDWDGLWLEHSRYLEPKAPNNEVDWEEESVLAIFWESKDALIREPAFAGIDKFKRKDELPRLRFRFFLNTACVGLITDISPSQFLLFKKKELQPAKLKLQTEQTKSVGCLDDSGFTSSKIPPPPFWTPQD